MAASNPSASYSLTMRIELPSGPGTFARVAAAIAEANGDVGAIDLVRVSKAVTVRDITVSAADADHGQKIVDAVRAVPDIEIVHVSDRTFLMHLGGKIEVHNKVPVKTRDDLSMAYTPGVARVCMAIHDDPDKVRALTIKQNSVAVVTDGTAVLGLGRHRPPGGHAGDGGQGDAVQGVRRHRRLAAVPGHHRHRRDHRDREGDLARASAASTSKTSPRRAASRSRTGCGASSTSRCSTTISTAPRWWCWPAC